MVCLGWYAEVLGLRVWQPMESCETEREIGSVCPAVIAVTEQQEGGQRGRWTVVAGTAQATESQRKGRSGKRAVWRDWP